MDNFMNSVKIPKLNTNVFDLSFDLKTTMKMGYLYPSPPIDVVPGDKYRLSVQSLAKLQPMVFPLMHRLNLRHEWWFVPKRILWKNYEKWATETLVGGVLPAAPYFRTDQYTINSTPGLKELWDHFGLPINNPADSTIMESVSAMPYAAYQLIWNEFYRDQNLVASIPLIESDTMLHDGNNTPDFVQWMYLKKRAWDKDYFTTCLPFAQKGDPVMIPIGTQKVVLDPLATQTALWRKSDGSTFAGQDIQSSSAVGFEGQSIGLPAGVNAVYDPLDTLVTQDTGEATSINDLRLAYALQRLRERLARGGSRFSEFLKAVFDVQPQDSRLDRPEYIGGSKTPIVVSEVLQTSESGTTPLGDYAGHGVGVVNGQGSDTYYAHEPGYIICLTSVMPVTSYQQGIHPMWTKLDDPRQEYTPDMANIGEQTVKNKEIYAFQGSAGEEDFGYQVRYGEYKTSLSYTTGEMRTTLKDFTATRIFDTPPALNEQFIMADPTDRMFAVTDPTVDNIYMHMYHDIKAVRKMPKYGTPTY